MENNIVVINNIRGYLDQNNTAYLNLEDVARGLGFVDNSKNIEYVKWDRVRQHLSDLKFSTEVSKDSFIPENIFYRLAMKAKNEIAEVFQAKVADEILPQIRQTGGYIPVGHNDNDEDILAKAVLIAQKTIDRQKQLIAQKDKQIEDMTPNANLGAAVSNVDNCILIGGLSDLLLQNGINGIGQNKLFDILRENGYLSKRKGYDWNNPTQKSMQLGLFKVKESVTETKYGTTKVNMTTMVTGKGQQYFINKFLNHEIQYR